MKKDSVWRTSERSGQLARGEGMADETTYYSDQSGVRVTGKQVIVNNVTYAMANISPVSMTVEKPSLSRRFFA